MRRPRHRDWLINQGRKALALISIGLIISLFTFPALASDRSMRCGGHLIYAGSGRDSSSMYEVLKKCGEPEAKQGDVWIYKQGNVRRMLTFRADGRLLRIESVR